LVLDTAEQATYDTSLPSGDVATFTTGLTARLQQSPFSLTAAQAISVAGTLLPDVLKVDLSKLYTDAGSAFPNGRRLRDDVADNLLNLLTNGHVTTDGVADDNGVNITDGGGGATVKFPYVGSPNSPPQ
jgi:hypothetical protein